MRKHLPFEGSRGHCRSVADTETARLLILFLEILLGQGAELGAVFSLHGAPLAVELLDVVEPCDAIADPRINGLESILEDS